MKKLILAAIAVVIVAGVQAATVSWKANKQDALKGLTIYTFDASSYATVIDALTAGQEGGTAAALESKIMSYALADESTGNKGITASASKGTATAANVLTSDQNKIFQIIFDGTIADGQTYKVTDLLDVSGAVYTPPQQKLTDFAITSDMFATTKSIGGSDTPEPTSGLLLLLGVAGLALRRKQA